MLYHNFKVLLRTLLRNRAYTFLNVLGLHGWPGGFSVNHLIRTE